jgi:hypothetical protein
VTAVMVLLYSWHGHTSLLLVTGSPRCIWNRPSNTRPSSWLRGKTSHPFNLHVMWTRSPVGCYLLSNPLQCI